MLYFKYHGNLTYPFLVKTNGEANFTPRYLDNSDSEVVGKSLSLLQNGENTFLAALEPNPPITS